MFFCLQTRKSSSSVRLFLCWCGRVRQDELTTMRWREGLVRLLIAVGLRLGASVPATLPRTMQLTPTNATSPSWDAGSVQAASHRQENFDEWMRENLMMVNQSKSMQGLQDNPMHSMASMKMYFHEAPTELIILFNGWKPNDLLQYGLSLCVLFVVALTTEWLTHRGPVHLQGLRSDIVDAKTNQRVVHDPLVYHAAKFWLAALRIALHFFLMLVVMTFDVGCFVSIVTGLALGYATWASDGPTSQEASGLTGASMSSMNGRDEEQAATEQDTD